MMSGYTDISEPGLSFFFSNGLGLSAVYTMQKHKGTEDEHLSIGLLYNTYQVLPSIGSMHSNTFSATSVQVRTLMQI